MTPHEKLMTPDEQLAAYQAARCEWCRKKYPRVAAQANLSYGTATHLDEDRTYAIAVCTAPTPAEAFAEIRAKVEAGSLTAYLRRQWEWSARTFGEGKRTLGIIQHVEKELGEIRQKPDDLSEWIDVVILALDGYWRHGGTPESVMTALQAKQDKNFARKWPTPTSEDVAIEHDRSFGPEAAVDAAIEKLEETT